MKPTLLDVAKISGFSVATVSRAINNDGSVTQSTKKIINETIEQLGYVHRKRRNTREKSVNPHVLIIAGEISNPITIEYINGIRDRLKESNRPCLVAFTDLLEEQEIAYLEYAIRNNLSGVFLINAIEAPRTLELLGRRALPVVLVNRYLRGLDCDLVKIDNYRCGYMATKHLIDHGHRRIAHLAGPSNSITCQDRTNGFKDAMQDHGLIIEENTIFYGTRDYYASGVDFGKRIIETQESTRCTAIYSTTALMALGIRHELNSVGITIPQDISLICSDDSEMLFYKGSQLTTVGHNPILMGEAAAELLLERISAPENQVKHIVFAPTITDHSSVRDI